jgi:hypothetical protein
MALAITLLATVSWASDLVNISSLLANPESYKMKLIRVDGVVSNHRMNHFIGNVTKLEKCIQHFTVKDDSGVIDAVYATICPSEAVILNNGDRVTIEAHFSGLLDVRSVKRN